MAQQLECSERVPHKQGRSIVFEHCPGPTKSTVACSEEAPICKQVAQPEPPALLCRLQRNQTLTLLIMAPLIPYMEAICPLRLRHLQSQPCIKARWQLVQHRQRALHNCWQESAKDLFLIITCANAQTCHSICRTHPGSLCCAVCRPTTPEQQQQSSMLFCGGIC
jgi:hypothetical protein